MHQQCTDFRKRKLLKFLSNSNQISQLLAVTNEITVILAIGFETIYNSDIEYYQKLPIYEKVISNKLR
jgi:hypothetical protein